MNFTSNYMQETANHLTISNFQTVLWILKFSCYSPWVNLKHVHFINEIARNIVNSFARFPSYFDQHVLLQFEITYGFHTKKFLKHIKTVISFYPSVYPAYLEHWKWNFDSIESCTCQKQRGITKKHAVLICISRLDWNHLDSNISYNEKN